MCLSGKIVVKLNTFSIEFVAEFLVFQFFTKKKKTKLDVSEGVGKSQCGWEVNMRTNLQHTNKSAWLASLVKK